MSQVYANLRQDPAPQQRQHLKQKQVGHIQKNDYKASQQEQKANQAGLLASLL
jgi:hypothetical protein